MLNISEYNHYIQLSEKRKDLKEQISHIEKEISALETTLIDELLNNNMSKISIGDNTAYIRQQIWAQINNKEDAINTLVKEGYGDYVKPSYNSNQVSKLLRELEERGEPVPSSFKGVIDSVIQTKLIVKRS